MRRRYARTTKSVLRENSRFGAPYLRQLRHLRLRGVQRSAGDNPRTSSPKGAKRSGEGRRSRAAGVGTLLIALPSSI
jgi:hypothetical protein